MKIKIGLITLLFFTKIISGQNHRYDSLQIHGNVNHIDTDEPISKAKFEIFVKDTILWRTFFTNDSGEYAFKLPLYSNLIYSVKISYPKYVYKIFQVNMKGVPLNMKGFSDFSINIGLFKADSSTNYDLLNLPLMRYSYNSLKNNFEYDLLYMEAMRSALDNFKRIEGKRKKEKIQNEIIV